MILDEQGVMKIGGAADIFIFLWVLPFKYGKRENAKAEKHGCPVILRLETNNCSSGSNAKIKTPYRRYGELDPC